MPIRSGILRCFLDSFDDIDAKSKEIYGKTLSSLDTQTIIDKYYKIFEWIGLFDFNIILIIGIVIIVSGFNMITALLVLILERTQMIGILKALGSANWSIRKVFLYNAAYLIGIGLVWGNAIGLGAIWLQDRFHLVKFPNPQEYYIDYVPVHIDAVTDFAAEFRSFDIVPVDAFTALLYHYQDNPGEGDSV